jgi:hypothetical protein
MRPDVESEPSVAFWTITFAVTAALIVFRHWRRDRSVGLLLTYVVSFAALHWLAASMRLLPWFETFVGDPTLEGLRESTLGLIAFAVGVEIANRRAMPLVAEEQVSRVSSRLVNTYLLVGVVVYAIFLLAGRLPIIAAVVSTGSTLVAVGVALKAWEAQRQGRPITAWVWVGLTAVFPLVTVVTQGFLGYGFVALLIVASFVASQHRSRTRAAAGGLLLLYLGLSVYVTYMRDRSDIRELVWGGERVDARIDQLQNTMINTEWFDPQQIDHLNRIEKRLNQNKLVGAVVLWLGEGNIEHARGGTLLDAVVAIIPRALWPDKPETAGSGNIVSMYSGLQFTYGTSVGVGQVMELYINFGTAGVLIGFVVIGALVGLVDRRSAEYLAAGDIRRFVFWYMPGLSLLQIGGALAEVTATAAASWCLVRIISKFARDPQPMASPIVLGAPDVNEAHAEATR